MKKPKMAAGNPGKVAGGGRWLWTAGLIVMVGAGIYLRAVEYAANRSLWLDEAALAQNVLHLPLGELAAGRLGDNQVAPPGFLLATRGVAAIGGGSEQALRLIPFVAGVGLLGIFGWWAGRRLGALGGFAATALLALSWPLVYYSNEFKQYSLDALIAFSLWASVGKILDGDFSARRAAATGAAGVAALWFSQPAIFSLAALGVMGLAGAVKANRSRAAWRWMAVGAAWAGFFALLLWLSYDTALGNTALYAYHDELFLRLWPAGVFRDVARVGGWENWKLATADASAWFWLGLVFVGAWAAWRNAGSRRETIFLGLGIFFTALASALRFYPLSARLLLFLLPGLFWWAGRGVDAVTSAAQGRKLGLPVALALLIGLWPLARAAVAEARAPSAREQLRPVVEELGRRARPGEAVLVFDLTRYAFDYYWARVAHAEVTVREVRFERDEPATAAEVAVKLAPLFKERPARVWLVTTHDDLSAAPENLRAVAAALRAVYSSAEFFGPANATAQGVVFFPAGEKN